jgi:hypothetical protein
VIDSENIQEADFSFLCEAWIRDAIQSFVFSEDRIAELADLTIDGIKQHAELLCKQWYLRFKKHNQTRIKDSQKHSHWCLQWARDLFPRGAIAMVCAGHVVHPEVLECANASTCLLENALATSTFIKIDEDSDLQGSYLYFCLLLYIWIRSGKATGQPSSSRNTQHKRNSMLKDASAIDSKFSRCYPDEQANFSNATRRGYFNKLQQYSAISFRRSETDALCSTEGEGLFSWPSDMMKALKKVNFRGLAADDIHGRQLEMIGYFFELVYDLSLSPEHNVSESPGFETPLGIFGGQKHS